MMDCDVCKMYVHKRSWEKHLEYHKIKEIYHSVKAIIALIKNVEKLQKRIKELEILNEHLRRIYKRDLK